MIKFLLGCFDLIAPLIRALGADYAQFRAILEAKLIIDTRRRGIALQNTAQTAKRERQQKNSFLGTLAFYLFMGFLLTGMVTVAPPLVGMTLIHSYILLMITMALFVDYSSVLLDTTDNAILQPRPVTGRTVLLARVAHIVTYLSLLALSLSAAVLIAGTIKYGLWFLPVFLATLGCGLVLVVSLTHVLYLVAMRLTSAERIRDIISYLQIVMMILMITSSQILPRLVQTTDLRFLDISHYTWIYFYPPTWMAAPIDMLAGHRGHQQMTLTLLAVLVPFVALLFVLTSVAPRFNRLLVDLDAAPASDAPRAKRSPGKKNIPLASWLSDLLARSPAERSSFEMIWNICSRDRAFKMRAYPQLVLPLVMSVGLMLNGQHNWLETLRLLPTTSKHLLLLYISSAMVPGLLVHLRFTDKPDAAWVYYALPIAEPGQIMLGALKAVMVRFIMPSFLLISALVVIFWGSHSLPDIAMAFCSMLFISAMDALLLARSLPFTVNFGTLDMSGRFARSMLMMLVPATLGFIHLGLQMLTPWALAPFGGLILFGAALIIRRYGQTSWRTLGEMEAKA